VYDQVKQAIQDILAPELQALKGEIRRVDERINALDAKIDARFREMEAKIVALDTKFETKFREMETKLAALDEKFETRFRELDSKFEGLRHEVRTVLEIRERLAALEAKVGITRS